ncbi:MAG: 4'-phosphopantetheinyl transferase superfamily protein, partial [Pseudonocardiaceae bacterium]
MLKPYLRGILDIFDRLPVQPPTHPIWSATTVDRYPDDPDRIRDLITRHLLEPVRFGPLVRRLYEQGTRAFVQVGTGSLPAFVADTLVGLPHLAVSANIPRRSGLDQLRRVAAALWVEGWAPRFHRLPCTPPAPVLGTLDRAPQLPAAEHPVLAELEAALRDAAAAATDVVSAWARTAPRPASAMARQVSTTRTLSLATMPYLVDHCFYRQPDGWAEPADRFPVVPLTTILELMADTARALRPGSTVVGIQDVQALRWLAVAPPVTVTTSASLDSDGNVSVILDGYARGTVLLAGSYPVPPDEPDRPLPGDCPCDVTAAAVYRDRWMFHGPRFQGVVEVGPIGDDGIQGVLAASAAPGALLDNAGQLLGLWIMRRLSVNLLAYPTAVARLHWYGPHPLPGERMSCAIRIVSVTDTEVVADLDLRRADGRLWARIDRWRGRRFDTDEATWQVHLFPERNRIAQRQPGGWYLLQDPWPDPATRELFMRRYLSAAERAEYQRRNPRAARQWLLGRVAVKDAVRQWLWDAGAGPVFPIEITVSNDISGQPRVAGPFDEPPQVSLAHTGSLAAALVGSPDLCPTGVGIDIEQITYRDERTVAAILTGAERRLLDTQSSSDAQRASWVTRFWTAKEAVAKATGTG